MKIGCRLAQVIENATVVKLDGFIVSTSSIDTSVELLDKNDLREDTFTLCGVRTKYDESLDHSKLDLAKDIVNIYKAGNLKPAVFKIENSAVKSVEFI